jgi:hypothetical protein
MGDENNNELRNWKNWSIKDWLKFLWSIISGLLTGFP